MRVKSVKQSVCVIVLWASLAAVTLGQADDDPENPFKDVAPPPADLSKIVPAQFAGNRKIVKLPAPFTDIVAAAGGRYLIMHLNQVRQLAVFDVSKAALVKLIPVGSDDVAFAAGAEKLIVVLREKRIIQRWSLKTFERELTVASPTADPVQGIVMGSASDGPTMLIVSKDRNLSVRVLDPETLKLIEMKLSTGQPTLHISSNNVPHWRASGDGRVFVVHGSVMRLSDSTIHLPRTYSNSGNALPNSDGSVIYTPGGLFTSEMLALTQQRQEHYPIPAVQPGYYITLPVRYPNVSRIERSRDVGLYIEGEQRRLVTLEDVKVTQSMPHDGGYRPGLTLDKRFWHIPDAKLLVQVPIANDHLILHKVDIDRLLEQSETDYLFVTSRAPSTAGLGKPFEYQVVARSKKGGVKYELSSGPEGMKIDTNGKITWPVPANFSEVRQQIIVAVKDNSGQETFHSFAVRLPEAEENAKKKAAAELARATKEREVAMAKARVEQDRAMIAALAERGPAALERAKKHSEDLMRRYEEMGKRKPPHPVRSWTDSDGNLIEARLTEIFAGFANLQSTSGQMFLAPISRLSEVDQAYVKKISQTAIAARKKAEAEPKKAKPSLPQLKMIGLAMMNVTQNTKYYPSAYSISPEGKPLLSWRVHLLPYIGAGDLYNLFKKDEPWNSRYNKELLAYMPPCYRANGSKAGPGKTNFLAIRGERSVIMPPTTQPTPRATGFGFPIKNGLSDTTRLGDGSAQFIAGASAVGQRVSFGSIKDGTASTALVVEVPDAFAVEWTKPDDWEVDDAESLQELFGFREEGFYSLFADGSVQLIPNKTSAEMILRIFDRADGKPAVLKGDGD